MRRVLIDACGWVAVVEAGINIDKALLQCCGFHELAILPRVLVELENLGRKNLLIDMLRTKAELIEPLEDSGNHTDDQLLAIASLRGWPILTVDTELKRRISQSNLSWIEVSGRSHLRMVG